ncbi:MAG: helix-turn-helix domain-containing protein [Deltaproteobacteria bacterium]|jgi:excisionase family DNA binding protein|nr:helix-turn-helix domain-containing protein [Deltaproteobacteria bacterium]
MVLNNSNVLDTKKLAGLLRCPIKTVQEYAHDGLIPTFGKIGRGYRFSQLRIFNWLMNDKSQKQVSDFKTPDDLVAELKIILNNQGLNREDILSTVLLTEEVAILLGINENTVCRYARKSELPARKVGKGYRFFAPAVCHWITHQSSETLISEQIKKPKAVGAAPGFRKEGN